MAECNKRIENLCPHHFYEHKCNCIEHFENCEIYPHYSVMVDNKELSFNLSWWEEEKEKLLEICDSLSSEEIIEKTKNIIINKLYHKFVGYDNRFNSETLNAFMYILKDIGIELKKEE